MTETRKFGDDVFWHHIQTYGVALGWDPGWRREPGYFDSNISRSDPYWGQVLDRARVAYGDPNMRFNTFDPNQDRYLVFGDGTSVPVDGTLAYRDAANNRTYLLNDDGSVSLLGANSQAGQPIFPSGFRRTDDGYIPLDAAGHQIAPAIAQLPNPTSRYHDHNGVLVPANARGDYYVDDPAGGRRYFDAAGKPITEQQFKDGLNPVPPGAPGGQGLPTDVQQSGRAADAVRRLHEELKNRYSQISDAEGKLSEVLLNARATTVDGQQKLNKIQQDIVAAINNPALALDTPAGEQTFLKFLRSQVAAIADVLASGSLTAEDQSKAIAALTGLYAADQDTTSEPPPRSTGTGGQPESPPAAEAPAAPVDLGLPPAEPLPDPTLSDLGLGAMPLGPDPLAGLASTLPAALGAFPPPSGFGGSPLDGLGGLAAPLAGLASQAGDPARRGDGGDHADEPDDEPDQKDSKDTVPQDDTDGAGPGPGQPAPPPGEPTPAGTPGDGAPPGAPAAAPLPPTTVQLPDGSTANARTQALAQAVKAFLGGLPVQEAFRQAGIELPPPGTPVTHPVDPSRLAAGNIGMFSDHYVVALSSVKALADGEVVPLSSVASAPGFLGWMDPTAPGVGAAAPPVGAPVPAPVPLGVPAG